MMGNKHEGNVYDHEGNVDVEATIEERRFPETLFSTSRQGPTRSGGRETFSTFTGS